MTETGETNLLQQNNKITADKNKSNANFGIYFESIKLLTKLNNIILD